MMAISHLSVRSIAILFALVSIPACDRDHDHGQVAEVQSRLESAAMSGATSFTFGNDPNFSWDRMYVFGCYSTRASVEKTLGFPWPDFDKTSIESSDSVTLVVFIENSKVVGWYEQPRKIELGLLNNDKGYTRQEAVFDIDRSSGKVELKLRIPSKNSASQPTE